MTTFFAFDLLTLWKISRLTNEITTGTLSMEVYLKTDKDCEQMSELPEKQVKRLRSLIQEAETNLAAAKELLISIVGDDGNIVTPRGNSQEVVGGKVVEGVFDGQIMIGPDGKSYPVPAN